MAHLSFAVTGVGLAVPVWIGLTDQMIRALVATGKQVPAPVGARGLLDTGTDVTAVVPCHSDMLVTELAALLPDVDVLIGLDMLLTCKLLVDGPARQFTLEF
jgi:hypothetical protein